MTIASETISLGAGLATIGTITAVLDLVVRILFAIAAGQHANQLAKTRPPLFVPPVIWALATLCGGVMVAAIYWVLHYLRDRQGLADAPLDGR